MDFSNGKILGECDSRSKKLVGINDSITKKDRAILFVPNCESWETPVVEFWSKKRKRKFAEIPLSEFAKTVDELTEFAKADELNKKDQGL
jgi:hypothetical protein